MSEHDSRSKHVLTIQQLRVQFTTSDGIAKAVDEVTLDVGHGETLGLVGESGCGKSVTALSILRLLPSPPARVASGRIVFRPRREGQAAEEIDLLALSMAEMRRLRGNRISMIFQEPMTALNPVFSVGAQIEEVLLRHRRGLSRRDARLEALRLLEMVRIPDVKQRHGEYPHQLSGGMRQRVVIAMALACDPELLLADEPTTALDVTVQAQILALMEQLKAERHGSVVLISHDLGVIASVADTVAVMYAGQIVEQQPAAGLFDYPLHPYTQCLMKSIPARQAREKKLYVIPGGVPNPTQYLPGCRFAPRCPSRFAACDEREPPLAERPGGGRVRCFLYEECAPK